MFASSSAPKATEALTMMVGALIDSWRRRRRPRPAGRRGRQQVSVAKQPCAAPEQMQQLIFPVLFIIPRTHCSLLQICYHLTQTRCRRRCSPAAEQTLAGINGDSSDEAAALFTAPEPAREYQNQSQNPIWLRKLLRYVLIRLMSLTDPPPGLKPRTPSAFSGERNAAPPLPAGS